MKNINEYKNRFNVLLESTMGDVKPLIFEQDEINFRKGLVEDECSFPDDSEKILDIRYGLIRKGFKCIGTEHKKVPSNKSNEPELDLKQTIYKKDLFKRRSLRKEHPKVGIMYVFLDLNGFTSKSGGLSYLIKSNGKTKEGNLRNLQEIFEILKDYK